MTNLLNITIEYEEIECKYNTYYIKFSINGETLCTKTWVANDEIELQNMAIQYISTFAKYA